ncbi:MAG: acyltransferase [Prevotella sp.]|nr:acyltransferase [Prevotella sp.]
MKRERNFELMRVIAMFFIVVYHAITHGIGNEVAFNASQPVSILNLSFFDLLLVFSSVAVNLYVMVSGYFLADLNFKISRVIRTWLNACFYSCVITILFFSLSLQQFSFVALGKSFFPISTDAYWFVTQYIGLLILSPFLALLVKSLSYRQYVGLLIGGAFICLSIVPDFPLGKRFYVAHGNSVWFFAYLFLVAGFIKHHLNKISAAKLLLSIISLVLLTFVCEVLLGHKNGNLFLYWLNYNSLPFLLSVLVFVLFKQMQVPESRIWNMLIKAAPYTFGVYLIHDHLLVREWLWSALALPTCHDSLLIFVVLGACVLIFVLCVFVDAVRKKLFALLRIDDTIAKLDKFI